MLGAPRPGRFDFSDTCAGPNGWVSYYNSRLHDPQLCSTRAARLMPCLRRQSYASCMSDSPLSRHEIYAAAAAHDELGPEYSDAVVASFLEKVNKEIDARVDARLASNRQSAPPAERDDLRRLLKGVVVGIGASGIAVFAVGGNSDERLHRVVWVLLLLVVICTAAAGWAGRRLSNRRAAIPPARPHGRVTN